jgi:alpha-L-fucosidase
MKLLARLIAVALLATALAAITPQRAMAAQGDNFVIDDPLNSPRTQWWSDARFGMFVHWGLYSAFAGQYGSCRDAEWIKRNCGIPDADYAAKATTWNPTSFNANAIVQLAKDAGQQYVVITGKHHDGFAMWPTQVNDWNIHARTPFQRDPLRELSDAARANGIRFGVYYSIWDWHDPDFLNNFPAYLTRAKAQLRELVTNYNPDVIWFDGEWDGATSPSNPYTAQDGEQLEQYVRSLKPGIVINNRVIKRRVVDGDYGTPEQELAGASAAQLQESCMTINGTWGYAAWDTNFKSPTELTQNLVQLTSNSANFLLNIGPTDTGAIAGAQANALRGVGAWMNTNNAAIHGAGYSGLTNEPSWGKITRKGNKLYLNVYNWPGAGGTIHVSARSPFAMTAARVLGSSQAVTVRAAGDGYDVIPSGAATNAIATVIEADISTPAPAPAGTGTGLKAEYFNNTGFTGAPAVTRVDPTVNYAWRFSGSPAAAIGTDNFASRWTGQIQPRYSETYTFTTVSDDTVRLWVNGQLVISNTNPHGATVDRGSITLTAGQRYDIRMEQTDNGGEAYAKLLWASPNTPAQIVPKSQLYPPGAGAITSALPGNKCIDGGSDPNGTRVQLWDCNATPAQLWTWSNGTLTHNGKCLDVNGQATANGTLVQLWNCNGGQNQQWSAVPDGSLKSTQSGKCLDVPAFNTANGTQPVIWDCNGGTNQKWALP